MLTLIKNLDPSYEIWDKAATIRFKKPGRSTLHAAFKLEQAEIDQIHEELSHTDAIDRIYNLDLSDEEGSVCATVEKTVHIRKKSAHTNRENESSAQKPALKPAP
jgi:hypothetical protein